MQELPGRSPAIPVALALPADERPAYLTAECDGNEALRQEVESLLSSHERARSFLETPAVLPRDDSRVTSRLGAAHQLVSDRLARFRREARVLASLNHPHVAQIHGFEEADGIHALVMELVEGPTLADLIGSGAMPIDEALTIASQIADALDAAHEQGIIHRDLKPANIKVREDGTVKVLDFGLARSPDVQSSAGVDVMQSPTLSVHATEAGLILGTAAAYMSPEQARGKAVDRRTDLWAFGCVLYEMLTTASVRRRESDRCAGGHPDDRAGLDEVAGRDARSDPHVAPAVSGKESRAHARFRHGCTVGDRRCAGDTSRPACRPSQIGSGEFLNITKGRFQIMNSPNTRMTGFSAPTISAIRSLSRTGTAAIPDRSSCHRRVRMATI
jgi:tRNA A-37 threonylcarbamoyl transferase component Bud32